jgi:adenine-specific DNA-methyltransferase
MAQAAKTKTKKQVETLTHEDASRKNIPTAEYEPILHEKDKNSIRVAYDRRNRDLDPQLVWRGKDAQDRPDLIVHAPPLYIQEKIHPKVLIDDLQSEAEKINIAKQNRLVQTDLFADFNGLPDEAAKTEFYQHDARWSNRMILGDSLQVMASLAEREGLRGKVQCIYFDPPYGIKFNSNFQWSTTDKSGTSSDSKDKINREAEQVKAYRDTWRDGIHSYLTYLRDRLNVSKELLSPTGSIFVQIGDENVHRVRTLLDEVFGGDNFIAQIYYVATSGRQDATLDRLGNYILWFSKNYGITKFRQIFRPKDDLENEAASDLQSQGKTETGSYPIEVHGKVYLPNKENHWKTTHSGMTRLLKADRIKKLKSVIRYRRKAMDFPVMTMGDYWVDTGGGAGKDKVYVVQTAKKIVERCILMATDPGDLVLDPTCGSGTTAHVAEQWGRRWITIDTSRVSLALARARIMGARYPYYLLVDSEDGALKEAEITHTSPFTKPTTDNIRYGFVYERVPHITLKSIANNIEIDVIWDKFQEKLEPLRENLNEQLKQNWQEWEIPCEADPSWSKDAQKMHRDWWDHRIARQKEIDASIAAKADFEYLYDKPYADNKKIRVAGPFTVESLSPHRTLTVGADDELIDPVHQKGEFEDLQDFGQIILENLKTAGVQQAHKNDKIDFISLTSWPGDLVCAEGVYIDETESKKRAAIFIGPEFGTVSRPDLVSAAREAANAGFDVLIACAFNYDAHSTEFGKLGRVPVLKARMNADLHMADDLKNTGKGNLFVIFGEPDIDILDAGEDQIQVKINGVDVFHPNTGEVRSDGADGIACWFIDTDYNEESFFVRHAYFLGANDPYKSLKKTLKAEINQEAWETLNSDISRPFAKPKNGRIAVKVINHLGDEVMKVYKI